MRTSGTGRKHAARSFDILRAAKYTIIIVMVVFIVLVHRSNAGGNRPFTDVEESVESLIDTDALQKADGQTLKRYYGLNAADYDGVMLYVATYEMSAEEVLLIRAADESQVQDIEDAIRERLAARSEDFEGYLPEQSQLLDESVLVVRGNYIFLAVSPNAQEYEQGFLKSL